jgi:hypothetical protein
MTTFIIMGDQQLVVSNRRFFAHISFAQEVAVELAETDQQKCFVSDFKRWWDTEFFNGFDFDLDHVFPSIDQKKFWAICFQELAHRIYRREIGNQDDQTWQPTAIGDAYMTSRMLVDAVSKEINEPWAPR